MNERKRERIKQKLNKSFIEVREKEKQKYIRNHVAARMPLMLFNRHLKRARNAFDIADNELKQFKPKRAFKSNRIDSIWNLPLPKKSRMDDGIPCVKYSIEVDPAHEHWPHTVINKDKQIMKENGSFDEPYKVQKKDIYETASLNAFNLVNGVVVRYTSPVQKKLESMFEMLFI